MAYYVINYSKLRIWKFVEYSKMIYLDGDIQVYENIDHLFDLPDGYFYAVMDFFWEKSWSHTTEYKIGGQRPSLENHRLFTSTLGWMFLFEPGLDTYEDLLRTLEITPLTTFAEQDFLNMYFKKIYKPIPLVYNLVLAMLWRHHPEKVELDKVKVVHYCAACSKPWRYTGKEANMDREDIKMLVSKWWDIYNDYFLDHKKSFGDLEGESDMVNLKPFITALTEAGLVKYVAAPSAA
ncbi:unnamed protein product [Eruca vesicaria subsp. sativa]|uniref:Hexosyltransferase n=1 Tax=Eruca vesicaria subsp. sativa TaxID=29727 RepID=A0ABC8K4Y3_ERUVS|nr:unnamed protein product [Eruca vesicaria subsp. sativa]